jgi:hypothetical protein
MSASIGNGQVAQVVLRLSRQARCTNSLSVEAPSTWASRSANSPFMSPKPMISVGQTKVKSFGQKNTTSHLPHRLSLWPG